MIHAGSHAHILLYLGAGGAVNVAVFQCDRKHCVYVLIVVQPGQEGPLSILMYGFLIRARPPL